MHGRGGGEERNKARTCGQSLRVLPAVLSVDGGAFPPSSSSTVNFFSKDGRKISVGDCALFKPPEDSPPFVGRIRCLVSGKEDKLTLGVNWLYRPAELKLGRGTLLEAAPNEIFYSFHEDETPAASLLHPCKVAFLPKDVELPSGICSFVCRRVYDITKKCLWWLTDQDYIIVRQVEVDQLLYKTRLEMHETVQAGGRSPKPMNGPTSISQLKPGSDSAQNSASSFPSQGKGKKRERLDQGSEPAKRERPSRMEDGDFGHGRPQIDLKSEIAKITEKGGLENSEGVEKLVQLMITERNEKKLDLVSRSMLAGVISATEKLDCLSRFVQLRGLPVFDEWLQEVHKGRIGYGSSAKDDRSTDDFLLTLLRALDKLPVNLTALQMCNIGKSVNHLRSHKNIEIQKKARSLVDTWKKRVEAEMDAKSHNNSQSCSNSHVKTVGVSGKEDSRNSAAGSGTVAKISSCSSRNRKSTSGFPGPSGIQRETGSSKYTLLHGTPATEKMSQSRLTCEKAADSLMAESNNNHKFVVKIPNRGRSPAQSASAGSLEHHSPMNRASSPVCSEKHEQLDHNMKEKNDTYRENVITDVNSESWQSDDFKDVLTGCDEGDGSPAAVPNEGNCMTGEDAGEKTEVTKTVFSSSADARLPVEDDDGMNLLADVAAGESSKSDVALPIDSPQRTASVVEHSPTGKDTELKCSARDDAICDQSVDGADDEHLKRGVVAGNSMPDNADSNSQEKSGELNKNLPSSNMGLPHTADQYLENGNLKEITTAALVNLPSVGIIEKITDIGDSKEHLEKKAGGLDDDGSLDTKQKASISVVNEVVIDPVVEDVKEVVEGSSCLPSMEIDVENKNDASNLFDRISQSHQKPPAVNEHSTKETDKEALSLSCTKERVSKSVDGKVEKDVETDALCHASCGEKRKPECGTDTTKKGEHVKEILEGCEDCERGGPSPSKPSATVGREVEKDFETDAHCHASPAVTTQKGEDVHQILEDCEDYERGGPSLCKASATVMETEQPPRPRGSKLTDTEADKAEEHVATNTDAPATGSADMDAKVEFDLNEGFNVDEGKFGELKNSTVPGHSAPIQLVSPLAFPVSSVSSGLPSSLTVVAAAKGPFVPPDDLLQTNGAVGWKGSAATSAFRPAEPRKTMYMPLGSSNTHIPDASARKQSLPPLDIDLNVPDERVLEDLASRSSTRDYAPDLTNSHDLTDGLMGSAHIRSSGGLELDLNRVDEPADMGNHTIGSSCRLDVFMQPISSSSTGGILNVGASVHRDFDLNSGLDEASAEPLLFSLHNRSINMPSQPPVSSLRINNTEIANFSSRFPTGNTYSAITVPSLSIDREQQPFPIVATGGSQRVLGPTTGATPFNPDIYRGSVLSSSPAVPFAATPFQYPVFPFGNTFPLPSTTFSGGSTTYADSSPDGRICFPAVHSQLLGPATAIPSHYPRPYIVSLPDGSNNGGAESGRKRGRQGLDLNAGPGGPDIEGRDETTPLVPRQLSVAGSLALTEEQARMYQAPGGILKRNESEGGWDGYKQTSWQ